LHNYSRNCIPSISSENKTHRTRKKT